MLILLEFKELALENPTYLHENKFCWDIWFTLVWIGLYKGFIVLGAEKKAKSMWTFNAKSWPCKLYGAAQQYKKQAICKAFRELHSIQSS